MSRRRLLIVCAVALAVGALYVGYRVWYTPLESEARTTGEPAPSFTLTDHVGQSVSLDSLLSRGPAVIIFYRGHW